jgi:cell division protein FtsN
MKPTAAFTLALALGICFFAAGCTASSQLDEDKADQTTATKDSVVSAPAVVKPAVPAQTGKQGFTTKDDTIEVESAQRTLRTEHQPVVAPRRTADGKGLYAVQIGAFKKESHAEHARTTVEKRFHLPAAKIFDDALKLYKVVAGKFTTQREAMKMASAMKKKYPREYQHVWVLRRTE